MERRRAAEDVRREPAAVPPAARDVAVAERGDDVRRVEDDEQRDGRDEVPEGRGAPADGEQESHHDREQQEVECGVRDRDRAREPGAGAEAVGEERRPEHERDREREDERVAERQQVAPHRVATPHEGRQAEREEDVARHVEEVGRRREGRAAVVEAEEEDVACSEQRRVGAHEVPAAGAGAVREDADRDRDPRRLAEGLVGPAGPAEADVEGDREHAEEKVGAGRNRHTSSIDGLFGCGLPVEG